MGLSHRHQELLEARGLDVELLERLGVESSTRLHGDCIAVPFFEGGKVVNHKYRTISGDKRFAQDQDARKCFYNIDVLEDQSLAAHPLIITEGELDAWSAMQAGFPRTISVPDGAPAEALGDDDSGRKYSYLVDVLDRLKGITPIILATDGDSPGINLMNDLAIRLGRGRCQWLKYPLLRAEVPGVKRAAGDRLKDLNEVLMAYGQPGVAKTIAGAAWFVLKGKYRMSELPPLAHQPGYSTGLAGMDRHFKLRRRDFIVITGIPNHGKTVYVNDLCCRMAWNHEWVIAIASFEQEPQTDHRRNLRTFFAKKPEIEMTTAELAAADAWIDEHFVFIVPDEDDDADLKWVLERAHAAVVQDGASMVVIDPWNEMEHVRPEGVSLTEYTGYAIKQLRKFRKAMNVSMVVVAHPTKLQKDKSGVIQIPTLYDISDSAHWFNKSDVGIIVHRLDETTTLLRIAKTKYHDIIGKPGDLKAHYLQHMARFETIIDSKGIDAPDGAPAYEEDRELFPA